MDGSTEEPMPNEARCPKARHGFPEESQGACVVSGPEAPSGAHRGPRHSHLPVTLLLHISLHFETDLQFDITGNAARVGYLVTLFFSLGAYCVHFV